MRAAVELATAIDHVGCDRQTQRDHIVRLLDIGNEQARSCQYTNATSTYYSIFQPGQCDDCGLGLRRVAPIELYEEAASRLRVVANVYAEQLVKKRCFLAAESPGVGFGVPRGALNLYLISNQYDVFTKCALRYAARELQQRNINRFLMSSVRARLEQLRRVRACAPLLREEKVAFDILADFERHLHAYLAPRYQALRGYAITKC